MLLRDVGTDRVWRYRVASARQETSPAITFVNVETGCNIPVRSPEIAALLHAAAAEYGLAFKSAAITVAPAGGEWSRQRQPARSQLVAWLLKKRGGCSSL